MDEALGLPTEKAVQIALRTQQVLAYENGVGDVADPLGGSYLIESLTDRLEKDAMDYITTIDRLGGALAALEQGFQQREIQESAYKYQREVEEKERVIVGVNDFKTPDQPVELLKLDASIGQHQAEKLRKLRAARDQSAVDASLAKLNAAAGGSDSPETAPKKLTTLPPSSIPMMRRINRPSA
jgi:methylmalonyl-CoA mutase N-terminal domain/subunit